MMVSDVMNILFGSVIFLIVLWLLPITRRALFTKFIFSIAQKSVPKLSSIERQVTDIGTKGFDAEFFSGRPNWNLLRSIRPLTLTETEKEYLNGPTQEICASIDEWALRKQDREITEAVWLIMKKYKTLGLRVSQDAGGKGFSAQAQSIILGTIASRSIDASIIAEVPNSLGPDELIEQYGSAQQKKLYLKKFAQGEEISCFAITSAEAGSDIGSMRDIGVISYGMFNGEKKLGVSLSWSKRYITLAPKATLLVLAFNLFDPEKILGVEEQRGITLALIPTNHSGVNIGRYHLPSGSVFPNGPIWGEKVFIPLEWIVGEEEGIGQGWKMIMQSLSSGRGISVPSMSVATMKFMTLVSSAYARVRRQFNKPIGKIEGVEERLARMIEHTYVAEAARAVTAASIDADNRPLVIASIMKYKMTENARIVINDAMDIHGGKAVMDGPLNYLQSAYQMIPVAITAEGSNIITRSLIITGQAILSSHPYFRQELEALENKDKKSDSVKKFDRALTAHISLFLLNSLRAIFHGITHNIFAHSPSDAPHATRSWYKQLSGASSAFALITDTLVIAYQGRLKKKQSISAQIADALSELYLLSCTLKRFEDDGAHPEDIPLLELSMRNGLARLENILWITITKVDSAPIRWFLFTITFPRGRFRVSASLKTQHDAVSLALEPTSTRQRLTRFTYIPISNEDPVALLEATFRRAAAAESLLHRVDLAVRKGELQRNRNSDWILEALKKNIVTDQEVSELRGIVSAMEKIVQVDDFDRIEILNNFSK